MSIRRSNRYADFEPDIGVFDDLDNDIPADALSVRYDNDNCLVITKGDSSIRLSRNESTILLGLLPPGRRFT